MKIAIKHRTNDCKDYMRSHTTVIIGNLKEHKTLFIVLIFSGSISLERLSMMRIRLLFIVHTAQLNYNRSEAALAERGVLKL